MLPLAELFLLALLTLTHDVYFFLSLSLFFLSFSFCSRSRRRRTSPVAVCAWRNASPLEASSPRICPMLCLGSSVPHFGTYTGASTNQECKRSASTCVCRPPYILAPSCTELPRPSVYVRGGQCTVPHASPATYTAAASGVASRQTTCRVRARTYYVRSGAYTRFATAAASFRAALEGFKRALIVLSAHRPLVTRGPSVTWKGR